MSEGANWRDQGAEYEPPRTMGRPLLLGILVQLSVLTIMRFQGVSFDGDWAFFSGEVIGASLPIPLFLWFAFMRRREPRGWWKLLLFLPLTFIMLFGRGTLQTDRDAEFRRASNGVAAARERLLERDFGSGR